MDHISDETSSEGEDFLNDSATHTNEDNNVIKEVDSYCEVTTTNSPGRGITFSPTKL